jgi:hypothetical protein
MSNKPEDGGPHHAESDLYIYLGMDGTYICQNCALSPAHMTVTATAKEMAEHVKAHRAAGHAVWDGVEEDLLAEPPMAMCQADGKILAEAKAASFFITEDAGLPGGISLKDFLAMDKSGQA